MLPSRGMALFLINPFELSKRLFGHDERITYHYHKQSNLIETIRLNHKLFFIQTRRTKTWTFVDGDSDLANHKKSKIPTCRLHFDFLYHIIQSSSYFQRDSTTTNSKLIWKLEWKPEWIFMTSSILRPTAVTAPIQSPFAKRLHQNFDFIEDESEDDGANVTLSHNRSNRFSVSLSDLADIEEMFSHSQVYHSNALSHKKSVGALSSFF